MMIDSEFYPGHTCPPMPGKTEHRDLPHPVAHPDSHGSIPMTDDRKRNTGGEVGIHHPMNACCFRDQCKEMERALAESRAEVEDLRLERDTEQAMRRKHAARAERLAEALTVIRDEARGRHGVLNDAWVADTADAALSLEPTP